MKIAIISPYYPPADGGIAVFVKELSYELTEKGIDIQMISREGPENFNIPGSKQDFIKKSVKMLSDFKPDVINAHSNWMTIKASLDYKKKYDKDVKVIFTFHTGLKQPLTGIKKIAFEKMLNRCNVVTFVSSALKNEIMAKYKITAKTAITYGGVREITPDLEELRKFKTRHNIDDNDSLITFIGPFEWKMKVEGIKILIKSFKEISVKENNVKLLLVGNGQLRNELEEVVKNLHLNDKVIFTGFVSDVSIPLHFTSVYAHISLQEGLPLALLEAMSASVPVVASRTGGIPEVITDEENGLLVNSEISSISEAIIKLLKDDTFREALGDKGKADVDDRFTWNKTAKQFLSLCKGEKLQ